MIRITSAHLATCADCRDKAAHGQTEPCMKHAAEARGLRFSGWRPAVVAAWSAPNPPQRVDAWKGFR